MKLNIVNQVNSVTGKIDLPVQFSEEIRPDLIKRAVESSQSNKRQPYGSDPRAGKRHSTYVSKRRRNYKGCYGAGISRVPRKVLSRNGTRMNWVGALAPGCVGGRRAHPPKVEKIWGMKINVKERRKAIRSAMAATMIKQLVQQRGHIAPKDYPFIIDDSFEKIGKTKELADALKSMGLADELSRAEQRKIRAGKGKARGRKYISKKGPLIVVSSDCNMLKLVNIPGVEISKVNMLNAELLAPGKQVARLTLFTSSAIKKLADEKLFTKDYQGITEKKTEQKEAKITKIGATEKIAKSKTGKTVKA